MNMERVGSPQRNASGAKHAGRECAAGPGSARLPVGRAPPHPPRAIGRRDPGRHRPARRRCWHGGDRGRSGHQQDRAVSALRRPRRALPRGQCSGRRRTAAAAGSRRAAEQRPAADGRRRHRTYLAFVEADPELYRFVVHGFPQAQFGQQNPTDQSNPIGSLSDLVGDQAAIIISDLLSQAGRNAAAAEPWGHGLVGLVRSAADWWLRADRPMPRNELAAHLTDLAWSGLSAVMQPIQEKQ